MADNNTTQNNLQNITTGMDVTLSMIANAQMFGGKSGELFGATFGVVNNSINGVISFSGSEQERVDLEKALVGMAVNTLAGAAVVSVTFAAATALTVSSAVVAPVVIIGAGLVALDVALWGDDLHSWYKDYIQKPTIDFMVKNDIDLPKPVYDFLGYSQKNSDTTTTISFSKNNGNTLVSYDTYSPTGTKTSSTVSAYNPTGDLIGRTTSQHQTGDFISVPSTSSPSSVLNILQQTQAKNETLAQDAFAIAKFVGLDKNSATTSDWITTLNSSTTTGNTSPSIPVTPIIYYNDPTYFNNNKSTRRVG